MSDTAKNTWSTANLTPRCITTNKALQERLSAVESALTETHHTYSNQERIDFEIKAWEVELLAEGGYNYVWLMRYTAKYHVSSPNFPLWLCLIVIAEIGQHPHSLISRIHHPRAQRGSFAMPNRKRNSFPYIHGQTSPVCTSPQSVCLQH